MKHTPTPWSTDGRMIFAPDDSLIYCPLIDHVERPEKEQEANAAFIVEACNAYRGLNATIDTLSATVERIHKERSVLLEAAKHARDCGESDHTLDAAIALCEGEGS